MLYSRLIERWLPIPGYDELYEVSDRGRIRVRPGDLSPGDLLPPPADDVAQDLVDRVFAHLEIALREIGIGDMGVPKRMKKIAGAFYDRTRLYDPLIEARDAGGLAAEIAGHLRIAPETLLPLARYCLACESTLASCHLDRLFAGPPFAGPAAAWSAGVRRTSSG